MLRRLRRFVAVALSLAWLFMGCSIATDPGITAGDGTRYDRNRAACESNGLARVAGKRGCLTPAEIKRGNGRHKPTARVAESGSGAGAERDWTCTYAPTYDNDWHNDVMCRSGLDVKRPYLLPGDSFVTESEIMAAAVSYERQLNGG